MTQSSGFEDKQVRYARTCLYAPYLPTGRDYTSPPTQKRPALVLLLKSLENQGIRFSAAQTFSYNKRKTSLSEVQFVVSELNSILKNHSSQYKDHPILQDILKLKEQDIRRSAIYSLGRIGVTGKNNITYYYNGNDFSSSLGGERYPLIQKKIVDILTAIVIDRKEDLDIRWMAAAQLQLLNIPMDKFFLSEKLVNPAIALAQSRWIGAIELQEIFKRDVSYLFSIYKPINPETAKLQYKYLLNQYGFIPGFRGITGLDFDIYSKQYIYDSRTGCGAGLSEVFNLLQNLFNGSQK